MDPTKGNEMSPSRGMFTASNSESRRVVPEDAGDRPTMKVVYVVLELQYQSFEDRSLFEEGMLKLLHTLPKVLKFLLGNKATDSCIFMIFFQ